MDTMTLQRFRELADAWGADVTRWPAALQPGAVRVLAGGDSDTARRVLAEAGELDAALHAGPPPAVPAALRAAILDTAGQMLADAPATPAGDESLSYTADWFPRPQAVVDRRRGAPSRPSHGGAMHGTRNERSTAGREPGRSTPQRAGVARVWHELGGLRMAGPALAMALVLGVALAEIRGDGAPGSMSDTLVVSGEEVFDEALFGADYEEYML